ncbi:hypothetical protein L210DRAFT_3758587 [Boletus edulis BED1]|uniref:RanBD1 domain-containing protein n=1 Tax=Boletus edulis BED1 TaxID=1328754 RepID=A0AAD4C0M2_BOLED|nr:hypothetical protein L210DRAFT_3758587 [Boletus edulis BED1]
MKRGAERQITKDGTDDDDIEEIQDPQGFQKADETTLARRQIRALPKRTLTASKPPALNGLPPGPAPDVLDKVEAAPQPKFVGFVGFGAGTSVSNSTFTFATQPLAVSAPSPAQPTPAAVPSFFGAPKPASMDSDAFSPKPATSTAAGETNPVAFKYFKSLRGLNASFLSAISSAVEKDPFCDVVNLVESYKNLRTTIQSEFDKSSQPSTTRDSVATSLAPIFGVKPPPEKTTSLFSMPKPSVGSSEAFPKLPSTIESGTKTGGFTFPSFVPPSSSAPTQLPFGITVKSSEPSSSAPGPEPPKSAASSTPASTSSLPSTPGFTFATPSAVESTAPKLVPGSSGQETEGLSASSSPRPTSTTPSFGSGSVPNFFATSKPTNTFGLSDPAPKPTSVFGNFVSGSSGTVFGNATATSSSTSASIFRPSSDKPVSVFGSASPPKTGAFTFGKPAGSIGNPVGFGFGGSSPSTGDSAMPGSSSSGFTFGVPSTKPTESLFSPPTTDKSSESTPQPEAEGIEEGGEEDAVRLLPSHIHDEEGEGEEDEETTHLVRCKVYRLFKSEDKNEWKDVGVGMFRLKKHKETNVRRALLRNSNTGRILINFRINKSLKPTLAKNAVSFVGYDDGTPTSFSIRVKTEEQAKDLKQALEREIATVQAAE